jgi:hypothetical protein
MQDLNLKMKANKAISAMQLAFIDWESTSTLEEEINWFTELTQHYVVLQNCADSVLAKEQIHRKYYVLRELEAMRKKHNNPWVRARAYSMLTGSGVNPVKAMKLCTELEAALLLENTVMQSTGAMLTWLSRLDQSKGAIVS